MHYKKYLIYVVIISLLFIQNSWKFRNYWSEYSSLHYKIGFPTNHIYWPGMSPRSCVGIYHRKCFEFSNECSAQNELKVVIVSNYQVLCHPRAKNYGLWHVPYTGYFLQGKWRLDGKRIQENQQLITASWQICQPNCKTCNLEGCLTCNGNRFVSDEKTCDCPLNSISHSDTPWCSDCEVAVLDIRFSDDLEEIRIGFDYSFNPEQLIKYQSAKMIRINNLLIYILSQEIYTKFFIILYKQKKKICIPIILYFLIGFYKITLYSFE